MSLSKLANEFHILRINEFAECLATYLRSFPKKLKKDIGKSWNKKIINDLYKDPSLAKADLEVMVNYEGLGIHLSFLCERVGDYSQNERIKNKLYTTQDKLIQAMQLALECG